MRVARLLAVLLASTAVACSGSASGPLASPTPEPTPTVAASASARPSPLSTPEIRWLRFHSAPMAVSFEYPVLAGGPDPGRCYPTDANGGTTIGGVVVRTLAPRVGTLDEVVDGWIGTPARVQVERREAATVAGAPARQLEYRSAGTGRVGMATFVARGDDVVLIAFDAGGSMTCLGADVPMAQTYSHIARSLVLETPAPPSARPQPTPVTLSVSGRVTMASDGRGVSGVRIRISPAPINDGRSPGPEVVVTSDANGAYSATVSSWTLEALADSSSSQLGLFVTPPTGMKIVAVAQAETVPIGPIAPNVPEWYVMLARYIRGPIDIKLAQ